VRAIERERGVTERDKQTDDTHRAEAEGRGAGQWQRQRGHQTVPNQKQVKNNSEQ
jgi:hypothetical protein